MILAQLTVATLLFITVATSASAYEGPVKKLPFTIGSFTTENGKTIPNLKIGYETYGTLNEKKDNAILISHFFLGNSHAAGRYAPDEKAPGYWDSIIGPGKPLDTNKYFIVASDSPVNINAKDKNTITTGPASINPVTNRPYALSFPVMTMRDFVQVQKALLDSLEIKKLIAVMGPSSGAVQSLTWAAMHPEMVERVIGVVPGDIECNPYSIAVLNLWMSPILMDPKWNKGDYYGREEPIEGLRLAVKNVVVNAYHYKWAEQKFARRWAGEIKNPAHAIENRFLVEDAIDGIVKAFENRYDANSFLYYAKAVQTWSLKDEVGKIKAKVLLIPSKGDLLAYPDYAKNTEKALKDKKIAVETFEIDAGTGHFDGLGAISLASDAIRQFLTR